MRSNEKTVATDECEVPKGLQVQQPNAGETLFAICMVLFSTFLLIQIRSQTQWIDGIRVLEQPRFWPAMSLGGMLLFALGHTAQTLRGRAHDPETGLKTKIFQPLEVLNWFKTLEYAAYFLIYIFGVKKLGYLPATILFCPLLAIRAGYRSKSILCWSVLTGIIIVLIFKTFLQVKLPPGEMYYVLPEGMRNIFIKYF